MAESKQELIRAVGEEMRALHNDVELMDSTVAEHLGLNRTDTRVLDILHQYEPLTPGQIAEHTGLTTGAVTTVIDRIERRGYARRVPDPTDRRKLRVELTERTRRLADDLYRGVAEGGAASLQRYTAEELRLIRDFLHRSRELNQREAARVASLRPRRD